MSKTNRRLAAIMFTDMVGYTALVQENEKKAKDYRDRHRVTLKDGVAEFDGTVLQYYGDGTLSMFPSAIQAVRSAISIQSRFQVDPPIPIRIGLHVGDVIEEEGGIFGDGVNVASRIQSLSVPGAVLISEKIFDEIKNQNDLDSVSLGSFELKNVREPVGIYAVSAEGLTVPSPREVGPSLKKNRKSVAVLPFVNTSRDEENEFFSDGISEEIISALSKIDGLQVTARTSSFAFKGKNTDMRDIGNELGVDTLLEGSVRRAGEKVRVTAQLINANDGFHFWSEVYDKKLEDIFAIQDEISRAIANKLRLHFGSKTEAAPSHNFEAYQLYLKALFHWNKWTPVDGRKALQLLEEATRVDPDFALAYAWQAFCYTYLGSMGQLTPRKAFPIAKRLTAKAFELRGAIAEAYIADGLIALFYDWEWDLAGMKLRKALEISPSFALGHQLYGLYLRIVGEVENSVAEVELAHELDPMSAIISWALAETYFGARRVQDALHQCRQTLLIDPTFRAAKNLLAAIQIEMGELDKAITLLEETRKEIGDELKGWTLLGYAYAVAGRREEAEACVRKLQQLQERDKDAQLSVDFAVVHKGLGDLDSVFRYLNEAVEEKVGGLVFMKTHPWWDPLRADPRFKEILRRIGFEK